MEEAEDGGLGGGWGCVVSDGEAVVGELGGGGGERGEEGVEVGLEGRVGLVFVLGAACVDESVGSGEGGVGEREGREEE